MVGGPGVRKIKIASIIAVLFLSFVGIFQNFESIPLEKLKPSFYAMQMRLPSSIDGTSDIRRIAPTRAEAPADPVIAVPESGGDLGTVSQDWMMRQSHLITGRAEERILANLNKKLNRFMKAEAVSTDADSSGTAAALDGQPGGIEENEGSGFRPTSLQIMSANRVQVGLRNKTKLSCSFEGDNMRWDLSRPINHRFDVNLQHETARAKSVLQFNYSW